MNRAYQNLGLPPETSPLMVVRTAIRRLHPDTLAVRSWREARKRYILGGLRTGVGVAVDAGAEAALTQGKSLLGVGIRRVDGEFERGDTVTVHAADDRALARGIANYGAAELKRIAGKRSHEVEAILGYDFGPEFIHRDDLVML